ncbi:MAG: Hsp20/alpha crystallin family protein [Burkholderiaceae bacterium]
MFTSMMYPTAFGDVDRLRRELDDLFGMAGLPTSIRSAAPGAFPALNIGSTPSSVEVYAFAPGIDPSQIDVTIDRGVMTISGERRSELPQNDAKVNVYGNERFAGRFRRAINLPEDIDPGKVEATYRDGVLRVSIARRDSALPKRITVQ